MYENKDIKPMLIGVEQNAFDHPDYIYELKLDGVRCIAYLDKDGVELRNKRNVKLTSKFPELSLIHKQVKKRCILDGELYVYKEGVTDFFEIQKRTLSSDKFKIQLMSRKYPATFTAFDVLYVDDSSYMDKPLMKRKKLLDTIMKENERINVSRYMEEKGIELFQLTTQKNLEGIVAKHKDSKYHEDKRTKEWIKCKNMIEDDYAICGYILKEKNMVSLILAQYHEVELVYKGHVTLGVSLSYLHNNTKTSKKMPFSKLPPNNEGAIWISPMLCGVVKFMEYTQSGGLRQPVFKGFREDKEPKDCIEHGIS